MNIHTTKMGVSLEDGMRIVQLTPFFFQFAAFGLGISVLTLLFVAPMYGFPLISWNVFLSHLR
jgi:hypothetical protein